MKEFKLLILGLLSIVTYHTNAQWIELKDNSGFYFDHRIYDMVTDSLNNVYAAGFFANDSGCFIAKWDGTSWTELGGKYVSTFNSAITTIHFDKFGNLYAAGSFSDFKGKPYSEQKMLAKWDGKNWKKIGIFNNRIACIASDDLGKIYVGGEFTNNNQKTYVAKYENNTWQELGGNDSSTYRGGVYSIIFDSESRLYAGGFVINNTNKLIVAMWDGFKWNELGADSGYFNGYIHSMAIDKNDNIYAGGVFNNTKNQCYLNKWNGKEWIASEGLPTNTIGSGPVIYDLICDSDGNVLVVGALRNQQNNFILGKWNGKDWNESVLIENTKLQSISSIIMDQNNQILISLHAWWDKSLVFKRTNPLGLPDFENSKILVYPNPFSNKINVTNTSGNEEYVLRDVLGNNIYSGKQINEIDFSLIPIGTYILQINTDDKTTTIKVLKD